MVYNVHAEIALYTTHHYTRARIRIIVIIINVFFYRHNNGIANIHARHTARTGNIATVPDTQTTLGNGILGDSDQTEIPHTHPPRATRPVATMFSTCFWRARYGLQEGGELRGRRCRQTDRQTGGRGKSRNTTISARQTADPNTVFFSFYLFHPFPFSLYLLAYLFVGRRKPFAKIITPYHP